MKGATAISEGKSKTQKTFVLPLRQLFDKQKICECVENHSEEKDAKHDFSKSEKLRRVLKTPLSEETYRCPEKEGTANALNMQNLRFGMKRRNNKDNQNKIGRPNGKTQLKGAADHNLCETAFFHSYFLFAFIWLIPPDIYACVKD